LSSFRKLNDIELDALSDEKLIEYIRSARANGETTAMTVAIQIFAYRQRDIVLNRVRVKLRDRPDSDIDATTDLIVGGAMFAAFEGESVGEFKALVNRIFQRRIADYFRRTSGTVRYAPLANEVDPDDEEVHGEVLTAEEELSFIWGADLVNQALDELSKPHRAVVRHRLFEGYSSQETVELVNNHFSGELDTPMTTSNVDQIVSRFRRRVRDLLDDADSNASPNEDTNDG
jgi:RNA polymerase sigma factor (sigma-70 family)